MSANVFSVVTEFKFDITHAVANSKVLQESTEDIARSANKALESVKSLGLNMLQTWGLGGGVAAVLQQAVKISDAFQSSVLDMSAVLSGQLGSLTGDVATFTDRLKASRDILAQIAGVSNEMGVDQADVTSMVKQLIPVAATVDNETDVQDIVKISAQAAAVAPSIGVTNNNMGSQISQFMTSSVTQGPLLSALQTLPQSFKGMTPEKINGLDDDEIMKRLGDGLKILADQMSETGEAVNMISYQIGKLKKLFMGDDKGMESIFKPLGDVIRPLFIGILKDINSYVKNQGASIVSNFSQLLGVFASTPKSMLASILQLREAHSDLNRAAGSLAFMGAMSGIGFVLSKLTKVAFFVNPTFTALAGVLSLLGNTLSRLDFPILRVVGSFLKWAAILTPLAGILAYFGVLWPALAFVMGEVLLPLAALWFAFQTISRAIALVKIDIGLELVKLLPKISEHLTKLGMALTNIALPITMAMDGVAMVIAWLLKATDSTTIFVDVLGAVASAFEMLGKVVVGTLAFINALFASFFQIILNLQQGVSHAFDGVGKAFKEGFEDFNAAHAQKLKEGKNTSNSNVIIGKVEIKTDIKGNMDPDRIAFAIKDQMLKAVTNPTQTKNRSFHSEQARR